MEPQWLDEDIEAALAWQSDKAMRCGGCGQPRDECMDESSTYTVTAWRCFACEAREDVGAKWAKDSSSSTHGLQFAIERIDRGD